MKRFLQVVLPAVIGVCALLYIGDVLSLRLRIPNREPYGTVTVREMYAVTDKDKSIEYMPSAPAPEECVNSLFPHYGDSPCWYLQRHPRQQININSGSPF